MNAYFPALTRALILSIAAMALLMIGQGKALASDITIAGTTGGCFGSGCTPSGTGQSQTSTLLGLTYNGSSFNVTTANGFAAIGSNSSPPNNFNNLGSFTLTAAPNSYTGQHFTLVVTFTAPPGAGSGTYSATLFGTVQNVNTGGVSITFSNPTQVFTFNGGTFTLTVNNLGVTPINRPVALTGQVTGATSTVPEPATLLLLGSGLTGVAASFRRRRRASAGSAGGR